MRLQPSNRDNPLVNRWVKEIINLHQKLSARICIKKTRTACAWELHGRTAHARFARSRTHDAGLPPAPTPAI